MAAAAVFTPHLVNLGPTIISQEANQTVAKPKKEHVLATLNFHKDNEDGSPPHPAYIDRPETFKRPTESHQVTITDVAGDEGQYTLDGNGFQFHKHTANEKDFLDDENIQSGYYQETEQLLKDM